jgi:RNA polymerase primary sigma factor
MKEHLTKFVRASHELEKEFVRTPTDHEIADRMKITAQRVHELRSMSRVPVSLDLPVGNDRESCLGDLIADPQASSPLGAILDSTVDSSVHQAILQAFRILSPTEEQIVRLRFGIGCDREHSHHEIAQQVNLSRERVREIEGQALKRFSESETAGDLLSLMSVQ